MIETNNIMCLPIKGFENRYLISNTGEDNEKVEEKEK